MPGPTDLQPILKSIRKPCRSGLWSSGVSLARARAVAIESSGADEIVLRVRAAGRPVPATVVLYPTELEWECDCPSRLSPCEHVAAAAIALGDGADGDAGAAPECAAGAAPDAGVAAVAGPATTTTPGLASTVAWQHVRYLFSRERAPSGVIA